MRNAVWLLASLAACSSLDHTADANEVHDAVFARTGVDTSPTRADLDPGLDHDAANLLQRPLSDDDGVRIALLNNRHVRAALARLGIARADLVQAGLLRNPVFDGLAKIYADGSTELELGLAAPFLDLFWRPLRERLAEHEFAVMKTMVTHELVHIAFSVRRAFVHVRAASQLVGLQQQVLATAQAAAELQRALHAAGNITDKALAAGRVAESRARLDLAAAEQALVEAREPVQELLCLFGADTQWTIAGELPADPFADMDLAHAESRSVAASLDLQEQRARLDALAQQQGLTSWQAWLPDGHLGAGATRETNGEWGVGPAISLELPLFDTGRARTHRLAQALREGLHRQTQLAVEIRSTTRLLAARARSLAARLRYFHAVHLPLREDLVQRTTQHYNAMQIGAFDVLQDRQLQLADQREALAVLRDCHLARIDLQELLAGSLPQTSMPGTWPRLDGAGTDQPTGGH